MRVRTVSTVFTALAVLGLAVPASAATISLSPSTASVDIGGTVSLAIVVDFTGESILGGGLDIFFDSGALGFVSFEFDDSTSVGDDPAFRRAPDVLDGELNGIAFGNFDGLDGEFQLGLVTFEALAAGFTSLTMAANEGGPPDNPGGFFSVAGTPLSVSFTGAEVTVVPIPAGLVLLFSALGALGAVRTRR